MGIPETIPAEFVDRTVFLGSEAGVYRMELGGIVSFDGRLDESRLRRALRLLLDAEPVLGCRFDAASVPPVWRRLDRIDTARLLEVRNTADPSRDAAAFIARSFAPDVDPQVAALLLRSDSADVLAVRVGHVAVDGAALKETLYLLGDIYRRLAEEPDWTPEPNVSGARAPHTDAALLEKLRSLGPGDLKTPPSDPDWFIPLTGERGSSSYVSASIRPEVFRPALAAARAAGATANDVILTAVYRTLWRLLRAVPGGDTPLMLTCDLRRHLPSGTRTSLANISSAWWVSVPHAGDEPFGETLTRVAGATAAWKRRGAGRASATGIPLIHRFTRKKGLGSIGKLLFPKDMDRTRGAVVLTNLGVVEADRLDFGGVAAVDVCLLPPVTPLGAGFAASTYLDTLHLVAGVEFAAIGEEMANAVVSGAAREIEAWATSHSQQTSVAILRPAFGTSSDKGR